MKKLIYIFCTILMCIAHEGYAAKEGTDNVHFSGALVAEPCTLSDEDANIKLDFGTIIESYLYQYQRTLSKPFAIHLTDCDPTLYKTVGVTFQGNEDVELPGMLMLDPSSTAQGVVIGITLQDGTPLPVNKSSPYLSLMAGNNVLSFMAYVKVKPSVLLQKNLQKGDFQAVATFILDYQ